MKIESDYIWKLVVGGDGAVGKTTILHRYIHNEFIDDMKMTIGSQFHTQMLERQGLKINLVLWDFSGQPRFRFLFDDYTKGCSGAFVMFDMSRINTIYSAAEWASLIRKNSTPEIPIVLLGAKADLIPEDKLAEVNQLGEKTAKENGCIAYVATSSKWGYNVNESIMYMVDLLISKNVR